MNDLQDLEVLLASRVGLLVVETHEEPRALDLLQRLAARRQQPLFTWTAAEGLRRRGGPGEPGGPLAGTHDPAGALRFIAASTLSATYVLLDFHPFAEHPLHVRLLKDIAQAHIPTQRHVVLVGYQVKVPPELDKLAARFALSLPDAEGIKQLVREEVLAWQAARGDGRTVQAERETFDLFLRHLQGLSDTDVRRLTRRALDADGILGRDDVDRLVRAKHEALGSQSVLAFEMDSARFADVAGLAALKAWLARRREAFLGDAAALGLDVPKGLMLVGVQGCGKSLAAKAVAGSWGVPLLRLDFGALYNKFLGETERNFREALKVADAMSPCVLWLDEIEKGVAGSGSSSDGGESRRVLGALLTWMAERRSRVFVVATSNDIEALPPELIRKGRLDEIFFVDLPDAAARAEILRIHLKRRKQDPAAFDLAALAAGTEGFSGAELEQVVVAALYEARSAGGSLATGHLQDEAARTQPLSVVMAERVQGLRLWARDRTVKAD
ncbi:MAG TPA: AAA family ATPase [Burkholderiaceae bacterium]|nr:AAA family ATPase [Burkholderiaceae bacterium]